MICPECKCEISEGASACKQCGFDLAMFKEAYERIYAEKIRKLNESENPHKQIHINNQTHVLAQGVHKPRCPYCNSENLSRITSFDKAVNIALFGILGNKRKYQWHCNNCKTDW